MSLVINHSDVSGSKAQMVAPRGAVRAMVPVVLLITLCSWRLLSAPRVCSTIPGVVQACSHRDCLLGFFLLRLLPWACSSRGSGSGLLPRQFWIHAQDPQRSLVPAYSLSGLRLVSGLRSFMGAIVGLYHVITLTKIVVKTHGMFSV